MSAKIFGTGTIASKIQDGEDVDVLSSLAVGNVSADFRWQGITHENSTVPVTLKDLYDEKKVFGKNEFVCHS